MTDLLHRQETFYTNRKIGLSSNFLIKIMSLGLIFLIFVMFFVLVSIQPPALAYNQNTINISVSSSNVSVDYNNGTVVNVTPTSYWFFITKYVFNYRLPVNQTIVATAQNGYNIIYVNQTCSIDSEYYLTSFFGLSIPAYKYHYVCELLNPNLSIQFQSS